MKAVSPLTVLITGTSRGLGNELVRIFLKRHPQSLILATSRHNPEKEYEEKWKSLDKNNKVKCYQLEVQSQESIKILAQTVAKEGRKIDILINNAGFSVISQDSGEIPDVTYARKSLETNTIGPMKLTKALLPCLSEKGRVVSVSSLLGGLKFHPEQTQERYSSPQITEQDIYKGVQSYLKACQSKDMSQWCVRVYSTSKMLLNAWSRHVLQQKWMKEGQTAICVTPGFCHTDMTAGVQNPLSYSAQSGAVRIYQTAIREDVTANVFYHRNRISDYKVCGDGLPYDDQPLEENEKGEKVQ